MSTGVVTAAGRVIKIYTTGPQGPAGTGGGGGAVASVNTRTGAIVLTSADVGLGSANNTADASKPVSTAQAAADTVVAANASAALSGHTANVTNPHGTTAAQVGLGNVTNTDDASKPVSTAQAAADTAIYVASQAYADGLVVGLLDDRGNHDASPNTFPTTGGSGAAGAVLKGDLWRVSVAGTLGGQAVTAGDQIRVLVNTPGQTAGNWAIVEGNFGFVPENAANKDVSGGYAGLAGFSLRLKNAAGTVASLLASAATVARTWTFPDKDGTVAMISDIVVTGLTGPITSTGNATAVAAQTGTGTTFVMQASPTLTTPNLGTPSAAVLTNATGTAAGLTAGTVTNNANSTGDVTSVGNSTTLTNAPVIAKVLTGYVSGAGVVAATDSILAAVQKLNGNDAAKAPLASPTFTGTVTLPASQIVNGVTLTNAGLSTNFLTAAGTYAAASGGSGLPTDGTGTMTGAIATTVGTMTSTVANGATAVGFNRNTSTTYSTAGAILDRVQNNGVTKFAVTHDAGAKFFGPGAGNPTLASFFYDSGATEQVRITAFGNVNLTGDVIGGSAAGAASGFWIQGSSGLFITKSTGQYSFGSGGAGGAVNTAIGRNADGVVEFNNGTLGVFRDWKARNGILTGNLALGIVAKTASYTVTANDGVIEGDATAAAITLTLPAVATATAGTTYTLKKTDASANAVIWDGNASETIDGATTVQTTTQWASITIIRNTAGTAWLTLKD